MDNGVRMGFIHPSCRSLLVFVDGPSDHVEHERFDWGSAALHALDTWKRNSQAAYPFDWTRRLDTDGVTETDKYKYI